MNEQMTMDETANVAFATLKELGNLSEVCQIYKFQAAHRSKDGSDVLCTVTVKDMGESVNPRYYVSVAKNEPEENGRTLAASSNPNDDLRTAIATVHWGNLG